MTDRDKQDFHSEHRRLTRRYLLAFGSVGAVALQGLPLIAADPTASDELSDSITQQAVDKLESWLTKPDNFRDVSRGKPLPHTLDEQQRIEAGLTRDTWKLEVSADPDHKPRLDGELTKQDNTAFTFPDLMEMAKQHAVRFPKVMTCLNIGCPLGNGIWEGVPLRKILWLTKPRRDLRRVYYYGYHNDDPEQMFRSSLPVGRILEDYHGLPPVILCYKLNGQWLTPERGGPVRVVVPEAYGFKSIKWLTNIVLSNQWQANDTYGEQNNDVESPLKTFCDTLSCPTKLKPNQPFAITGYAQVGVSGLSKVQVWLHNDDETAPAKGPNFIEAPWADAEILSPPTTWGGGLPKDQIPKDTLGFDRNGKAKTWPIRLSKAHWATLMPGMPKGEYTLRCRTVDANGAAQPMPRPFRKSGHAAIAKVQISVSDTN